MATLSLSSIPADVQLAVTEYIPDLFSLHSLIQLDRVFYHLFAAHQQQLFKAVAENHFDEVLEDALRLANGQLGLNKLHKRQDPKDQKYTADFIRRLLDNQAAVDAANALTFEMLVHGVYRWPYQESSDDIFRSMGRLPFEGPSSPEEWLRMNRAAYRIWTYTLVDKKHGLPYLKQFRSLEVLEMAHFELGVEIWVDKMCGSWGNGQLPPDRRQKISGVLSTGLGNICHLWKLYKAVGTDPRITTEFWNAINVAGASWERTEPFFGEDFTKLQDLRDIRCVFHAEPILDTEYTRTRKMLREQKARTLKARGKKN